jgi:hypothetical protein
MIKLFSSHREALQFSKCFDITYEYLCGSIDPITFLKKDVYVWVGYTNEKLSDLKLGSLTYQGINVHQV